MFEHNPIPPIILRDADLMDRVQNIVTRVRKLRFISKMRRRVYIEVSSGTRVPIGLVYISDRIVIGNQVVKSRDGKLGPITT